MNSDLLARLKSEIAKVLPEVKTLRHRLHQEPEIALSEFKTQLKVLDFIKGLPLKVLPPFIATDVVADLEGRSDRTVVLRADMDALPVTEETGLPYASSIAGMMHACGHDGHTAILAGTARVLAALQKELPVSVRFVFQPGEESVAAGKTLVEKGALGKAEAAYALHGWPLMPLGAIQSREGIAYAAGATFKIRIVGKGCHGAKPKNGINPIPLAAKLASRLYDLHEQENGRDKSVITVCMINAGTLSNIIPDVAEVQGTVRYLDGTRGNALEAMIKQAAEAAIEGSGAHFEWEYERNYDLPVVNSVDGHRRVRETVTRYLPDGAFLEAKHPTMGNEDFAYYLNGREGAMVGLGQGLGRAVLHNSHFDFNDESVETGMLFFCGLILDY